MSGSALFPYRSFAESVSLRIYAATMRASLAERAYPEGLDGPPCWPTRGTSLTSIRPSSRRRLGHLQFEEDGTWRPPQCNWCATHPIRQSEGDHLRVDSASTPFSPQTELPNCLYMAISNIQGVAFRRQMDDEVDAERRKLWTETGELRRAAGAGVGGSVVRPSTR